MDLMISEDLSRNIHHISIQNKYNAYLELGLK